MLENIINDKIRAYHTDLLISFKKCVTDRDYILRDRLITVTPREDGSFPLETTPPTVDEFGVGILFDDEEAEELSDMSRPQSVRSVISDVMTPPKGAITPPSNSSRIIFGNFILQMGLKSLK